MPSLRNLLHTLKVLLAELGDLPVALDAAGRRALGQDNVSALQTPCKQDLSEIVTAALRNLVKALVLADRLAGAGDLVLGAERRVGGGQDVILQAELNELLVGEEGVDFDLVDVGLDLGDLQELLEALDGPVGDTDGVGLARLVELLHCAPCGLGVLGEVLLDNVLSVAANLGHVLVVLLGGNGPVDKEEVNVVHLQLLERAVERPLDLLGLVQVVPDLCADEEILAGDAGVGLEEVADGVANLILVLVEPCAVEMAVANLKGFGDGLVCLALGALVGEGAEADGGDLDAVRELVDLVVLDSHCGGCVCVLDVCSVKCDRMLN